MFGDIRLRWINVIDVYIKRLREKIDEDRDAKDRLIVAERGIGYGVRA